MRPLPLLVAVLATAACATATGPSGPGTTTLYKYAGSRQCAGGGLTPAAAERDLRRESVSVSRAECGTDGRMYAAACGEPDGRIVMVDVPAAQAEAARRLGYKPLSEVPEARPAPCPK